MIVNDVDVELICRKYYTFGLNRIGGDSFSEYECWQLALLELKNILNILDFQNANYTYYSKLKDVIEKKINKVKKLDESQDCLFDY
jgi:hypothetical protein